MPDVLDYLAEYGVFRLLRQDTQTLHQGKAGIYHGGELAGEDGHVLGLDLGLEEPYLLFGQGGFFFLHLDDEIPHFPQFLGNSGLGIRLQAPGDDPSLPIPYLVSVGIGQGPLTFFLLPLRLNNLYPNPSHFTTRRR